MEDKPGFQAASETHSRHPQVYTAIWREACEAKRIFAAAASAPSQSEQVINTVLELPRKQL